MRRLNLEIPVRQAERIEAAGERAGLGISAIIRLAIDAWLDKEERKASRGDKP